MYLEFKVLKVFTKRSRSIKQNQNNETHGLMSKHIGEANSFTSHAKLLIRVHCDIFYYFSWSFNYLFISETFNKLFNLHEKQLSWESTPMKLYEKTHINKGDEGKKREKVCQ
jgi:hypothetical protein